MQPTTRSRDHIFQVYLPHYRLLYAYYNIANHDRALFNTSQLLGLTQTNPRYIALYINIYLPFVRYMLATSQNAYIRISDTKVFKNGSMYICMYVSMYVLMYVCMYDVCTYVRMCMYMYVRTYVLCM